MCYAICHNVNENVIVHSIALEMKQPQTYRWGQVFMLGG